jgi:hypothetical protein
LNGCARGEPAGGSERVRDYACPIPFSLHLFSSIPLMSSKSARITPVLSLPYFAGAFHRCLNSRDVSVLAFRGPGFIAPLVGRTRLSERPGPAVWQPGRQGLCLSSVGFSSTIMLVLFVLAPI